MYLATVIGMMVVLPIASILIEMTSAPGAGLVALIGKWFVFWVVGVRLLTAGISQLLRPEFTAGTIFQIKDPDATKIVSELGISNTAAGVIGVASLYLAGWTLPAAVYGLIFFALAGIRHIGNAGRNRTEDIATWTDIWAAVVLGVFVIATLL